MRNGEKPIPGWTRRNFLRFSLGAGAAASLPQGVRAMQADPKRAPARTAKAVILLWMAGGPSQIETWDPKPGCRNGGEFKTIDTTGGPMMKFSELLRICATQARHLNVIRSMYTHEESHDPGASLMHLGLAPLKGHPISPMGTVISYEKGGKDFLLPHSIAIDPPLVPQTSAFGEEYLPFRLNAPESRLDLGAFLQGQVAEWAKKRWAKDLQKAEEVMNSPLLRAFDCQEEPDDLRRQYGGRFGQNCLLARRLVQAGCSFVEVGLGDWDMHADVSGNCRRLVPVLDAGMGTLIRDLAEKDMLKETLVIWAGEFGRTPAINAGKGRDHYADGFSVVLAGGGLAGGRVCGDTGPYGDQCQRPVFLHNLFATVYQACGIDPNRTYETQGKRLKYAPRGYDLSRSGSPLKELF